MRKLFYVPLYALALLVLPAMAHAQEEYPRAAYIGPMREEVGGYRGSPDTVAKEECWKRPCLVIVNASKMVRIVEMRLNAGERDRKGRIAWSDNLLGSRGVVFPKNFLWWYKPDKMNCRISVKLVIRENAVHPNDMMGDFDLCGPQGPGIFVLRDLDDPSAPPLRRGTVHVEGTPGTPETTTGR